MERGNKKEFDQFIHREWIEQDVAKKLENNPAYRELREDNFESEWDDKFFKEHYGKELAHAFTWGRLLVRQKHRNKHPFLYYAEEALFEIQQKKLFDLQCQWRAELIEIEGINTTHDFAYWELNIREATFLSPITEDELKIYIDYLKSSEYRINWKCFSWQDYYGIKNDYHTNSGRSNIPGWYHHHNYATQNSSLLQLPDIRGDKEKMYLAKYDEYRTAALTKNPNAILPDNRPRLVPDKETIVKFFREFAIDNKVLEHIVNSDTETQGTISFRYYNDATEYLVEETEPLPIEENEDWKEAFLDVVHRYRNDRVARELPDIYADYLSNQLDFTLPNRKTHHDIRMTLKEQEARKHMAREFEKIMERGKQLCGE